MMAFFKWRVLCLGVVLALAPMSGCGGEGDITSPGFTVDDFSSPTNAQEIVLSGQVDDDGKVQVSINPSGKAVLIDPPEGANWAFALTNLDDQPLSEGTYSISVTALDAKQNSRTLLVPLVVDRTAEVTIDQFIDRVPPGSSQTIAGTVEVGATLQILLNGVELPVTITNGSIWRADLEALPVGTYLISAVATDALGNVTDPPVEVTITVAADAVPLSIQSVSPVNVNEQTITVETADGAEVEVKIGNEVAPRTYKISLVIGKNVFEVKSTLGANTSIAKVMILVDVIRPQISAFGPSGENVDPAVPVYVVFTEAMDESTVDGTSFTVENATGQIVAGTVIFSDINKAEFVPASPLATGEKYTVKLAASIKDLAGNFLSGSTWSFTTAPVPQ